MHRWPLLLMTTALMAGSACATTSAETAPAGGATASSPSSGPTATGAAGTTPSRAPAGMTSAGTERTSGAASAGSSPPQGDDPRISRSRGVEGGVVVLWPRIIPESNAPAVRAAAASLQKRMGEVVAKAAPGRAVDVRPEPERTCPMAGCLAPSLGLLLLNSENGCAVVAMVTPPGRSATRLVPWAGNISLSTDQIEFRAYPESVSKVRDFVPCDKLMEELPTLEANVEQAFRAALTAH